MSELLSVPTYDEAITITNSHVDRVKTTHYFGSFALQKPSLLPKPDDVPVDHVAYNPSAIWSVLGKDGIKRDIMYVRVEPDRSDPESSHLGKSVVRPYIIDVKNPSAPLSRYDEAREYFGEDAALTRINRLVPSGKLEEVWLLSFVDARPKLDKANEVLTLCTRFYIGSDLGKLEHISDGPEWMKDIRVSKSDGPLGTEIDVYGRPQPETNSGNITHVTLASINELTQKAISEAQFINQNLLPIGSGIWGGVNDVIRVRPYQNILAAHRAWRTGDNGHGRHYESVFYSHNTQDNTIVDLGVVATAAMFPEGVIKQDSSVDLGDVVFTGGGYNGTLDYMSFGVRDGSLGISRVISRA